LSLSAIVRETREFNKCHNRKVEREQGYPLVQSGVNRNDEKKKEGLQRIEEAARGSRRHCIYLKVTSYAPTHVHALISHSPVSLITRCLMARTPLTFETSCECRPATGSNTFPARANRGPSQPSGAPSISYARGLSGHCSSFDDENLNRM